MPNSAVFRRPFTKRGQNWLPPGRAITLVGDVTGSGGVVLGGTADILFTNIVGSATGSGGVELGGTSPILYTHFVGRATGAGGFRVGGAAVVSNNRIVYPERKLSSKVELQLNGVWTDITAYVLARDGVSITRGRADEGTQVDRSACFLTLNNRDGRFTPRNAMGPYYGLIGRNTPLRVSLGHGRTFMSIPGDAGDYLSTPDSSALSITGDLDVRIDLTTDQWRDVPCLCGKMSLPSNRSWRVVLDATGTLYLTWSTDGTSITNTVSSTEKVPVGPSGRKAIRVTLDVNNGATGHDVTFYTADSIDGTWTKLGGTVTTAGTTSLYDSTAPLIIGDAEYGATFTGRVHAFQVRDGIDGTLVADLDFASLSSGVPTALDDCGNTWTPGGGVTITNSRPRFYGEVSSWPQRWDISGQDVFVPIEVSGILRRLTAGSSPLNSPLFRSYPQLADLLAYWPCEDGSESPRLASAVEGTSAMTFTGSPQLSVGDDFVASLPLPQLANSTWTGNVPAYTATGAIQVRFLMSVPSTGTEDGAVICSVHTTGTAARWDLEYSAAAGALSTRAFNSAGTQILISALVNFKVNGNPVRASIELEQSGSDVALVMATMEPGTNGARWPETLSGYTIGSITKVVMNPAGLIGDVVIGHVTVQTAISSIFDGREALAGYAGETAAVRMASLAAEEGVPLIVRGDSALSSRVGPQPIDTFINILRDAALADGGILMEDRESASLVYRTRSSMYNQDARLTLDYDNHELGASLDPVDDDQATTNDVTVARTRGSYFNAALIEGPLSILPPPLGVGRYNNSVTLNVHRDEQVGHAAHWLVHHGTVDEARFPRMVANMANHSIAYNVDLTSDVMDLDVGDRLDVENPPPWLPPETITQLGQGFIETFGTHEYRIEVNCSPGSPWQIGRYMVDRYDTGSSELDADVSSSATSLTVGTTVGPPWTTVDVPFDVAVGGERMTVTAVTGSTSSQTFTVTRSVNGIVKGHSAGASVSLWQPAVVGL